MANAEPCQQTKKEDFIVWIWPRTTICEPRGSSF